MSHGSDLLGDENKKGKEIGHVDNTLSLEERKTLRAYVTCNSAKNLLKSAFDRP